MATEDDKAKQEALKEEAARLLDILRESVDHPDLHRRIQGGASSETTQPEQPTEQSTDRRRGPRRGEQQPRKPRRPNTPRPQQYTEATGIPINDAIEDALRQQRRDDEGPAAGGVREPRRPIKPAGSAGAAEKPPKR